MRACHLFMVLVLTAAVVAKKKGNRRPEPDSSVLRPDPNPTFAKESGEFNPNYWQGDIKTENNANEEDRNALADQSKLWTDGRVPYEIVDDTDEEIKIKIQDAIADFHSLTCIQFVPHAGEKDYIWFNSYDEGCNADGLGRSNPRNVNLDRWRCRTKGTVIHEIMHALGFGHEQARNDRDDYIDIQWNNIPRPVRHNFKKFSDLRLDENNMGFAYDYHSVMHYPEDAFSPGGYLKPSILSKDKSVQKKMGQRMGFSQIDVDKINKLYNCQGRTLPPSGECKDLYHPTTCQAFFDKYGERYVCADEDNGYKDWRVNMCQKSCKKC